MIFQSNCFKKSQNNNIICMKNSKNNNINLGFSFQFYVFGFSLFQQKRPIQTSEPKRTFCTANQKYRKDLHRGLKSIYLMLFLFSLEAEFSQNLFRNILKLKVALYKSCKNVFFPPKLLLYSFYPTFLFILLSLNYLINIGQMFNFDIDDLAVKPYIPHKSLLQ